MCKQEIQQIKSNQNIQLLHIKNIINIDNVLFFCYTVFNMKFTKILFIMLFISTPKLLMADDDYVKKDELQTLFSIYLPNPHNPMFRKNDINSIGIYIGQGTGSGTLLKLFKPDIWDISPMTMAMLQYSQPTTFFRLPARQNLHFIQNTAINSAAGLSFSALGISLDASLFNWNGFYTGFGIGIYMRDNRDRWVESRLVFGEKFFIGKNISDRTRAEIFTQHFSNGNFTQTNEGFNFAGLSVIYSF